MQDSDRWILLVTGKHADEAVPLANGALADADFMRVGEEDLGAGEIDALGHAAKVWLAER